MSTIEHFITFKRVVCTESMFTVLTILFHNIYNFWWCSTKGGGVELDQQIHRMALENVKDGINFKTLFAQVLKL